MPFSHSRILMVHDLQEKGMSTVNLVLLVKLHWFVASALKQIILNVTGGELRISYLLCIQNVKICDWVYHIYIIEMKNSMFILNSGA